MSVSLSARWLRTWAAATTLGIGALMMPLLWFAVTRAYLAGDWRVVLNFNALGEGPLELVVLGAVIPVTWLGLIGFHELLRGREVASDA
jgi:hypothetical protein